MRVVSGSATTSHRHDDANGSSAAGAPGKSRSAQRRPMLVETPSRPPYSARPGSAPPTTRAHTTGIGGANRCLELRRQSTTRKGSHEEPTVHAAWAVSNRGADGGGGRSDRVHRRGRAGRGHRRLPPLPLARDAVPPRRRQGRSREAGARRPVRLGHTGRRQPRAPPAGRCAGHPRGRLRRRRLGRRRRRACRRRRNRGEHTRRR